MKVFIAGATGVLGKRLVASFSDAGHGVIGLARDDEGEELVERKGGRPVHGDILDRESLVAGADDADVVIHAATAIPTSTKPTREEWARNDRVRREGAENLVDAAGEIGADRLLLQSIVWVARQPDGSHFDETAEPNPNRITRSALDAERIVQSGVSDHGYEAVVLRGGWFYAADTAHTRQIGERLRSGDMPIIGGGLLGRRDAPLSFIHVDDMASAFLAAAEGDATGIFHVVDDEPATFAEFATAFADRLGGPEPSRVPGWLARFLVGKAFVRLMTTPMPTSNEKLRRTFDWTPAFPSYREGLDQVVGAWDRDNESGGGEPE